MTEGSNYHKAKKHCYVCKVLIDDSNTYRTHMKAKNYICTSCFKEMQRERRKFIKAYILSLSDEEFIELVRKHYESP